VGAFQAQAAEARAVILYRWMAFAALATHWAWLVWVIFGWLGTRGHPVLRTLHIASVTYGALVEIFVWPCPLTLVEQWAEQRAGLRPSQQTFLEHYLEAIVYPDVPPWLLTWCGVGVCAAILGIYVRRFCRRDRAGW